MNKFYWIGALLIGVMWGCSQEMPINSQKIEEPKVSANISLDEALENANRMFASLEGGTRSKVRKVSSIEYCSSTTGTRSNISEDTLYYLVNYANDEGFAVLSANRKLKPIFAIGEEGNLSFEDTVENKGIAKFFEGLNNLELSSNNGDKLSAQSDLSDWDNFVIVLERITPRLTKAVQQWPGEKGNGLYGRYSTATISVAQAMTYFSKPKIWTAYSDPSNEELRNRKLKWLLINYYGLSSSSPNDDGYKEIETLFKLVEDLFLCNGNEFFYGNINAIANEIGYDIGQLYTPIDQGCGHEHQEPLDSDVETWVKALKEDRIIVAGNMSSCEPYFTWVVDGYVKYGAVKPDGMDIYDSDTLFHCVWGRGKGCNGYFTFLGKSGEFIPYPILQDDSGVSKLPSDSIFNSSHYTFKPR